MMTSARLQENVGHNPDAGCAAARIISISLLKGGVGKTTAAVQVAAALSQLGVLPHPKRDNSKAVG